MKNDPYVLAAFLQAKEAENWAADGTNPIVTISRQVGAMGEEIAYRASNVLTEMSHGKHPWVVVDKDLGERVIERHHLPNRISRFFSGEQILTFDGYLDGVLGLSVPSATMIEKLKQTVVELAKIGQVIFVGRAAHLITAHLPRAVHIRIIGSFNRRVTRIKEAKQCPWDEAARLVSRIDHQRRRFVSTYFHSDLDDKECYDMVFNTDRISVEEGALLISHLISSADFRKQEALKLKELRHLVLG